VAACPPGRGPEWARREPWVWLTVGRGLALADRGALAKTGFVVMLTPWKPALDDADVLLPIAPFTETSGTFVNIEGRAQRFHATVNPLGDARPGWKVLRVLGSLLGVAGFDFDTIDQVRA